MLILNHQASCICKAFKTDCGHLDQIEQECLETLKRADTMAEAIELVYDLGEDENTKALYLVTMGRMIERLEKKQIHNR